MPRRDIAMRWVLTWAGTLTHWTMRYYWTGCVRKSKMRGSSKSSRDIWKVEWWKMEWSWTRKKDHRKEGTCPHYLLTSIWTNSTRNSKGEVYPVCGTLTISYCLQRARERLNGYWKQALHIWKTSWSWLSTERRAKWPVCMRFEILSSSASHWEGTEMVHSFEFIRSRGRRWKPNWKACLPADMFRA